MVKLQPFTRYRLGKIFEYGLLFQVLTILFYLVYALTQPIEEGGSFHWNPSYRLALAFLPGILIGFFDIYIFNRYFKRQSFWTTVILRTIIYSAILAITLFAFVDSLIEFIQLLLFYALQVFFISGFLQVKKAIGAGRLVSFIMGKYRHPVWEKNILMFVDLNASTTLAETMDSKRYSEFIRDFIADLSEPIYRYQGRILQYVGDEIIVYWPFSKKKYNNSRALRCFLGMKAIIEEKKQHYLDEYGVLPAFKAGLHGGKVIVAEVGELKKEIAFLGDVVNTTARIQAKCADLNTNFLLSEYILECAQIEPEFAATSEGVFKLKGKEELIELFSVEKRLLQKEQPNLKKF